MTIIQLNIDDLRAVIREEVQQAMNSLIDRPITRKEAAKIRGCSERAIDAMIRRGELTRLPGAGHPRLSHNEVTGLAGNFFDRKGK